MSAATIRITNPGVLALIVDQARNGHQHLGITSGGPADTYSCLWANRLAGNQRIVACIELLACGAQFVAETDGWIALAGGVSDYRINQQRFSRWQSHQLTTGDEVEILACENGLRTYIAVAGGFDVPDVFGSATTVTRDKLGGLHGDGQPLRRDDRLASSQFHAAKHMRAPTRALRQPLNSLTLRIVRGYQYANFSQLAIQQLVTQSYQLGADSSRMAARFTGPGIKSQAVSMYSEGITRGAVQIPAAGIPIVMLDDRQTVGGYPKVGSVLSLDCDLLSQASAGCPINFTFIDPQQAHNCLHLHHIQLQNWFADL